MRHPLNYSSIYFAFPKIEKTSPGIPTLLLLILKLSPVLLFWAINAAWYTLSHSAQVNKLKYKKA